MSFHNQPPSTRNFNPSRNNPQLTTRNSQRFFQKNNTAFLLICLLLLTVSLACALPGLRETAATPTPTQRAAVVSTRPPPATPTPTPQPLPPDLIESDPFPGSELPLQGAITLYFNQPVEHASVEAAFTGLAGSFNWLDAATLTFTPSKPFSPDSEINLTLDDSIKAANGLSLGKPIHLTYQTVGYLSIAQQLPEPGAKAVDPSSAIVAAFNRPVVPLGGDPASLQPAFSLEPATEGHGEWLNTSTYIFYPEPGLAGGVEYTVRVEDNLTGLDGSPLGGKASWTFITEIPRLLTIEPEDGALDLDLDTNLLLTFNQPMDTRSVAANIELVDSDGTPVPADLAWNEDHTQLTFNPSNPLRRQQTYVLILQPQARSSGGTPLGAEVRSMLSTLSSLAVVSSEPAEEGLKSVYSSVEVYFSAPVKSKDVLQFITFSPAVSNLRDYLDNGGRTLRLIGDYDPETDYTLIISPNLQDEWNGRLGQEFILNFHTLPLDPSLYVTVGSDALFLTPQESSIKVQVTNLTELSMSLGSVPLVDFKAMIAPGGYDIRQSYEPVDSQTFEQTLDVPPNQNTVVEIPLSLAGSPLAPGFYFLRFNLPTTKIIYAGPYLLVVSNVNMVLKQSATDALVWAVDLGTGSPINDAPVVVYSEIGQALASGQTDAKGVLQDTLLARQNIYGTTFAVLGEPGQEAFSATLSNWSQGMDGGSFGYPTDYGPPHLEAYLYTDRPIYRPGQTVFFRGIARQVYNGRYTMPDQSSLSLSLANDIGEQITTFDLSLSVFGTVNGSYTLPEDAAPGIYRLSSEQANYSSVAFQVAEYRKPEIDLTVAFAAEQAQAGDTLEAAVNARYFFDAPAGNVPATWTLFKEPNDFYLPGYQVGKQDDRWLSPFPGLFMPSFGEQVSQGEGETDPQGMLKLEFATEPADTRYRYTLEVTSTDESGLPVSARSSIPVNPDEFFIGVRPDAWVGRVGSESGFDVQVVDWDKQPAGERSLHAEFQKVVWERIEPERPDPYTFPTFVAKFTLISSADFSTGADGMARLAFIPPQPGSYQLDVSGLGPDGENALTQVLLWVGGPGQAVWPDLANQHLRLTADKDSYYPGETAQVFLPNPLGEGVLALVTVERGVVLRHQVLTLEASGATLSLPLGDEDAPNVYVSATLLKPVDGGGYDFRQGYLILPVTPVAQALNVALTSEPERTGPGEEVRFGLLVTDADGNPVEGEFSLAVVDKAVLALADPNSEDILPAFYGEQPLGVQTSLALAASTQRLAIAPAGLGGGGGEFLPPVVVRERFPDTAYWEAELVTGADGQAQVTVPLPDNLTTWQVDVRGLTADTRVGQDEAQVVVTKDLLIRPVTPRFLVLGDHSQLAAIVQNNTQEELLVGVTLQSTGFALDDPNLALQQARLPAGGRARVEWWGTAQDVETVDLVFSASAGTLQDAARPALGALPVLHYTAPQTFGTSGTLDTGGEILELVSLPRSFDPGGGQLRVELAPSLSAAMLTALDVLEHFPYECTEQTVSRFLPNLETYRVMQEFGLEDPALQARLDRTLEAGLAKLLARQNEDGGWGWLQGNQSNPKITSYVLLGLVRARQAGASVAADAIQRAIDYLIATLPTTEMLDETWQLDRLAFELFVLNQAGAGDLGGAAALYEERARLNPWAQALLALTLEALSPGDDRAQTLISDLESGAQRSATGAHWENGTPDWQNMSTHLQSTAVVLYALAQHDPTSPLVADATRYLMSQRGASGAWASTYETAWTLIALTEVLRATGELAGDYSYGAVLNSAPVLTGQAGGAAQLTPVTAAVPVADLYPNDPNALLIRREDGPGRLYYTAHLSVDRPVEDVAPLNRGLSVTRAYYLSSATCPAEGCMPIQSAKAGELVTVRLTLTLPETAYYLLVEDYLPAGAEVLDTSLKTSQQGATPLYDASHPFDEGWGWWYFGNPQVYDDHIAWAADSLPPGTYELTYQLVILQAGEYRVLPARAWEFYFPEVQGNSAGEVFEIRE